MWSEIGKMILNELYKYLPQLAVTFAGVYIAFWMDKRKEAIKKEKDKQDLLADLKSELEEIHSRLTGKGQLLFPDIWQSAISSGQIRLLESEQVRKLSKVYREVQVIEDDAKWFRQAKEDMDTAITRSAEEMSEIVLRWTKLSKFQVRKEKELRKEIEGLLEEDWLKS
jgi:hypothetical protein